MGIDSSGRNLRQLAWVVSRQDNADGDVERAYALDSSYVYRRETDRSQSAPKPRYWRAPQCEILADDVPWDQGRLWDACDETGVPRGNSYQVHVKLEHVTDVDALDPETAKEKALGRMNLLPRLRATISATARLVAKGR